jgi:hypothetical protein
MDELVHGLRAEGVVYLRTVDRDRGDAVGHLVQDVGRLHRSYILSQPDAGWPGG